MQIIDLHCDTAMNFVRNKEYGIRSNPYAISLEKMKKANSIAQFFACFVYLNKEGNPYNAYHNMVMELKNQIKANDDLIRIARNYDEFKKNEELGLISGFLTIEEGGVLGGSIDNLHRVYNDGVRLITLTWNFENEIGFPGCDLNAREKGLKEFGIEIVSAMNELGMIIDVSHLSDGGFYDVVKFSKKPFVASHSNARSVCNHGRNITDNMIKSLAEKGGVIGINYEQEFISNKGVTTVEDIISHIKHIYNVAGIDVIALGSDFDGINSKDYEIKDIADMEKLVQGLYSSGFKEKDIEKICYKNTLRVIKDVMK